jgi:hypothetical protein
MLQSDRSTETGLIAHDKLHQALIKSRMAKDLSELKVSLNYMAVALITMIILTIAVTFFWMQSDKRFAENVRVSYVKLEPSGSYQVEFEDESKPIDFFKATVDSKLSEWVEKRYSKRKATITTDYGFSNLMMSEQLSNAFLMDFKAAKVAAVHVSCFNCADEELKVRNLQNLSADPIPGTKNDIEYSTLVFARQRKILTNGLVGECTNKMITILWHFRSKGEIVAKRDQLIFNPLGMEVLRADEKVDPTPVSTADCVKN